MTAACGRGWRAGAPSPLDGDQRLPAVNELCRRLEERGEALTAVAAGGLPPPVRARSSFWGRDEAYPAVPAQAIDHASERCARTAALLTQRGL